MQTHLVNLRLLIEEYELIANEAQVSHLQTKSAQLKLERKLTRDAEWTNRGARELVSLVRDYGSFVLRNATALALALGIEDGNKRL